MKITLSDPKVRKAIYEAYRGKCFYTGRHVPIQEMAIDHLDPKANKGEDTIFNCVLTFQDANIAKRDRIDQDQIERMKYIIRVAFAPRLKRILTGNSIGKYKGRKPKIPTNLRCVKTKDLFWWNDKGIRILSSSNTINEQNIHQILKQIDMYIETSKKNEIDFCDDAWLDDAFYEQILSLWYEAEGEYFKVVSKAIYYERKSPDKWGTIFFGKRFLNFLKENELEREEYDSHMEIEDRALYKKKMQELIVRFPPPKDFAEKFKKYVDGIEESNS